MRLKQLLKGVEVIEVVGSRDVTVSDIAYHTEDVKKGSCFVAIRGTVADGLTYSEQAIKSGAAVVVSSKPVAIPEGVTNVIVNNPRGALAHLAANMFGEPSKTIRLVGITGTNGKTTITYLLESIWAAAGLEPGVIGTVNYRYKSILTNPEHTTPGSYELQKLFREMKKAGVNTVAMEVSSHSLDQARIEGCHLDGAAFTNLTQDHLDYHLDMNRYRETKAALFNRYLLQSCKDQVWAVINVDDPFGVKIAKGLNYKVYKYSLNNKEADVFAREVACSFEGICLDLSVGGNPLGIKSSLLGRYNASNILAAVAISLAMDIPLEKIKEGVSAVDRIPGRLEPIGNNKKVNILVDYAHTPDAIKNVTSSLRSLRPARLITVFGCGGDRDKSKRPQMGYQAGLNSDLVVVTSDNPRTEDCQKIINEIVPGLTRAGLAETDGSEDGYMVVVNRREAIAKAVDLARRGDVVLIAGKGHEDYQIIGEDRLPFDDREVVKEVLDV